MSAFVGSGRVQAMRDHLKSFAADFGIRDMGMPEHVPNTRRALAVAEMAREEQKLEAFRHAVMEAHWNQGKNIEEDTDLREIAASVGLDPDAALRAMDDPRYLARVDAMRAEATARGVQGIPTFFVGRERLVGCQPYEVLAEATRGALASRGEK